MNYKIIRLDRRYAYYKQFPYLIEFHKSPSWVIGQANYAGTGVLDFDRSRRWFNEAWGWSQDIETRAEMVKSRIVNYHLPESEYTDINPHWAWSCRYQEYRMYVSEPALTMFRLKWSSDAVT